MGYGDYIPTGGQHNKKPLTKGQIKKLQKAYEQAGIISDSVKTLEKAEQNNLKTEIEKELQFFF